MSEFFLLEHYTCAHCDGSGKEPDNDKYVCQVCFGKGDGWRDTPLENTPFYREVIARLEALEKGEAVYGRTVG